MDVSSSSSRAWSSLFSGTSSFSVDTRSSHGLRFRLPQRKLVQEELRRPSKLVENSVDRSLVRCRVIRDVRDEALVSIFQGEKQSIPTTRYWPAGEVNDRREAGTLLTCDDHEEERISGHVIENGGRIQTYREDSSIASIDSEDEVAEESALSCSDHHPLDSRVETLEGIPLRQWLSAFVESINPRLRGIIVLNALTFLYGSNIAVVKETEFSLDPASFSVGRFAIAALVFSPFLKDAFKQPGVAKAGLELGVWAGIAYLAQAVGLMTTDAGRASFFTTFSVLTVPVIAGLMGKKVPLLTWFAAVAALFGVGLLETSGAPPSVGDAWSLLSAVVFGFHMIRTEYHSRKFSNAAFSIIALQMSVIAASSVMWSIASHVTSGEAFPSVAHLDWPELYHTMLGMPWIPMFYTGLFSTALCLSAELIAMRDVSATEAAVINALEPLWGAAFAWFALGERWGLRGWVGAAFILGGSLVTQIWGAPETPAKPVQIPNEQEGAKIRKMERVVQTPKEQEVVKLGKVGRDRMNTKQHSASRRK